MDLRQGVGGGEEQEKRPNSSLPLSGPAPTKSSGFLGLGLQGKSPSIEGVSHQFRKLQPSFPSERHLKVTLLFGFSKKPHLYLKWGEECAP